jgi:integrase/recombinase XerD
MAARVEAFICDHQGRRGISDLTAHTYRKVILALLEFCDVDELTPGAFHRLAEERGWAQSTRFTYWQAVKAYSAYRLRAGLADRDPFDGMKGPRNALPAPKPVPDLDRLKAIAAEWVAETEGRANAVPIDEWLVLAAYAGLRSGKIVRVRREHLRQEPGGWVLDVPQGKGSTSDTIPAHPEIVNLLSRKERGLLYPGYTATNVQGAGKRLMRKAGLAGGIHRLRHTYATWIYQATGDPFKTQRLCRHRSLSSTLSYARVADQSLHDAIGGLYG